MYMPLLVSQSAFAIIDSPLTRMPSVQHLSVEGAWSLLVCLAALADAANLLVMCPSEAFGSVSSQARMLVPRLTAIIVSQGSRTADLVAVGRSTQGRVYMVQVCILHLSSTQAQAANSHPLPSS